MISLSFTIESVDVVAKVYDEIQIIKYIGDDEDTPTSPVGSNVSSIEDWTSVSGTAEFPIPITLNSAISTYQTYDFSGIFSTWYSSRYFNTLNGAYSGWSDPILGETGDIYYDPVFPEEVTYGTDDQKIIDKIRLYIGDIVGLKREYGSEAMSSIHPDGKTYELDQKGWPAFITMGGKSFTSTLNPSVNGYKLLKFSEFIDMTCITCSGITNICGDTEIRDIENGVDIYYYTFRNSDREIMEVYDNCIPPDRLTEDNATSQCYMLQSAIDILSMELISDANEDGAKLTEDKDSYDPSIGLKIRYDILNDLKKRLALLVKSILMSNISGVLIN